MSSSAILLTPINSIQRNDLRQLLACPQPPRAQRTGLSSHFQSNQVGSMFAALPFDANDRATSRGFESPSYQMSAGEKVLRPRPTFDRNSFSMCSSISERYDEDIKSSVDDCLAIDNNTDVQKTDDEPVRHRSLVELMGVMQTRDGRRGRRLSFTNSAA